jgi:RimJ/RimL family protein N-acetyltransferase
MAQSTIKLKAMDPKHAEIVRAWINDPRIHEWMLAGHIPVTAAEELAFYEKVEADRASGVAYHFEIHTVDDSMLIGVCGLEGVDMIDSHGEVGIFIGDLDQQGKGYGREAVVAVLRFGFETLGLHTIRIRVVMGNERALALYRSIGFKDAGVLRECRYAHGRFHDVASLDMTRAEFDARYAL